MMDIVVENCWAAGASLTSNTNESILKTYDWLMQHDCNGLQYTSFYKSVAKTGGLSTSNLRNIFPLLRRLGLINDYSNGVSSKFFYTSSGEVYVKLLKLMNTIALEKDKKDVLNDIYVIKREIILDGLINSYLCNDGVDRKAKIPILQMFWFLNKFKKIDKVEFAYMLSSLRTFREDVYPIQDLTHIIESYRNGEIQINVSVSVRDDVNKSSNNVLKPFSYFTSFGYNISLIEQAGIVTLDGEYYCLDQKYTKLIDECLEVNKNG